MLDSSLKSPVRSSVAVVYRSWIIWIMVLNSTLGMFFFGYVLSVLNTVQEDLSGYVFNWDPDTETTLISILNSALTIGAGIGAFVGGSAAQKYGRRLSMIYTDLLSIAGMGLTVFANFPLFTLGRIITGFCCGLNSSIVPVYVGEIAPLPIKGTTGACNQIMFCFGSLIAYLFGFGLPETDTGHTPLQANWWRIMLGFPILSTLLRTLLLTTAFTYETPRYLVNNGKEEEARHSLAKIYVGDYATEQLIWLKREKEEDQNTGSMKYSELWTQKYRKRFLIGCFVSISQQFAGINALIFYSTKIFKDNSDNDKNLAVTETTTFAVLHLIATLFSGIVLKRYGRKKILVAGNIGIMLSILIISVLSIKSLGHTQFLPIPVFFYIIIYGLTIGPIVYVFSVEILPDIGVGIAILVNWLGAFLVALLFPPLAEFLTTAVAFGAFGVYTVIALFVILIFVKETRGLSQAEINDLYDPPKDTTDDDLSDFQKLLRRRSTKAGKSSNYGINYTSL